MILFAVAVLLLGGFAAAYWGAGLLLNPPFMSPMSIFPEQFDLKYEKVAFRTPDGLTLSGWFMASPSGRRETLVICHGWGDNKGQILEQSLFLTRKEGFNLLYFDFRGHGESAPSPVTMGKLELRDLTAALDYLKDKRPSCAASVGLFGVSMGAAVAAMGLAGHPELKAAVLESPFADFRQVIRRWAWNHFRVPFFPLVLLTTWLAEKRSGFPDILSFSPEAFIGKSKTPVLVIAGSADLLMPPEDVRRIYERAGGPKDFLVIAGGGHGHCREAAPAEYDARVSAFLRKHLAAA